jgi:hypothetical protein
MTANKNILIILLVTFSLFLVAQNKNNITQSKTILKGHVVDTTTGVGIPFVLVTLFFTNNDYKSVRADLDGYFNIQIPSNKIITDKSTLEFIIFGYKQLVLQSNFNTIGNLTVKMTADPSRQITRAEYEKLCKERNDYSNECGTKE